MQVSSDKGKVQDAAKEEKEKGKEKVEYVPLLTILSNYSHHKQAYDTFFCNVQICNSI